MSNEHHTPIAFGANADSDVLNAPLAELDEALVETKDDVTSLDGRLTTAEGEIDTLQSNVTNLQGRMTTAEGEIDTLQTNVTTLDSRLDTAEADIDTLQSNVTNLQGRMTTAEGEIDTLQSQMTTANSNISNLQGRMTTAEGEIDTLQTDVVGLDSRLDTAEPEIDTLQSQMTTANSNISNLQGRMTTAEGEIDTLQANSNWGGVSGELLIDDEIDVGGNTENVWVVTGVNYPDLRVINSTGPSQSRAIALINRATDPWTIDASAPGSNIRTPVTLYTPAQNEVLFFVRDGRVGQGYWHLVADVRVGNSSDLNFVATSIIDALNTLYNMVVSSGSTGDMASSTVLTLDPHQLMVLVYGSTEIETIAGGPAHPHVVRLLKASGSTWSLGIGADNIVAPAGVTSPYFPADYEVVTLVWETNNGQYHLVTTP